MSSPSLDTKSRPLVRPDLTFDEAAIRAFADSEFELFNGKRPRELCERMARRTAEAARARMADGSAASARLAHEANLRRYAEQAERDAALSHEERAERDAWIIRQCSTDGRLS